MATTSPHKEVMKITKMFTFDHERDILIKLILGTAKLVHYSLRFAVHIENGENGWCEILVYLPTLGVAMC